mgnify:CR=1 FL=1
MEVTKEDVQHCAQLACIILSQSEIEMLRQDMTNILNHVHNLSKLDLDDVEPYQSTIVTSTPRRLDEAHIEFTQLEALANAPQVDNGYVLVPKVM